MIRAYGIEESSCREWLSKRPVNGLVSGAAKSSALKLIRNACEAHERSRQPAFENRWDPRGPRQ